MANYEIEEIRNRIGKIPRMDLIHKPTPLRKLDKLTARLGGPQIFVKRDDLTGVGFGGNKSRKLEFIIADALAQGADSLVTWGSLQSNWCLQAAAAARRFDLEPVLILFKSHDLGEEADGNLLLDRILGAKIRFQGAQKGKVVHLEDAFAAIQEEAEKLKAEGFKPYLVSVGGSLPGGSMTKPLGALGYLDAFAELWEQAAELGIHPTHIVHATGSGSTQAGLMTGALALSDDVRVIGISVSDEKNVFSRYVLDIAGALNEFLDLRLPIGRGDCLVLDEYLQEGYGVVTREVAEAVRIVFKTEGIVLDPVYTGKAMAGLIDLINQGRFSSNDTIVFFHTGGTPALFPNRRRLLELLE